MEYRNVQLARRIVRTDDEIDKIIRRCAKSENDGSSDFPAMTYEQGVAAATEWLTLLEAELIFD